MGTDTLTKVQMKTTSAKEFVAAYEGWYRDHPAVFQTQVEALKSMLPATALLRGMEIGTGTGLFSKELGIRHGIEPSHIMRKMALKKGIDVTNGTPTDLPYPDQYFDFLFLNLCNPFMYSMYFSFCEAYRVLKADASFVVCFTEKDSAFDKYCQNRKSENLFFQFLNSFSTEKILFELSEAGFRQLNVVQSMLTDVSVLDRAEHFKSGYGQGSYIVVKAIKTKKLKGTSYNQLTRIDSHEKNSLSN